MTSVRDAETRDADDVVRVLVHAFTGSSAWMPGARPAYLEATSPRNAALYEASGFRPSGSPIPLPDGPPLIPMWRAPVAQS